MELREVPKTTAEVLALLIEPFRANAPTKWTPEIGEEILRRLSRGESLRAITRDSHMPQRDTVGRWYVDPPKECPDWSIRYATAKEYGCDALVELATELTFDSSRDILMTDKGPVANTAAVQRDRLIVDTIKWTAAKIYRRQYGEDGLFAGMAASGGPGTKVTVSIETVGASLPGPEPPTYDVDADEDDE